MLRTVSNNSLSSKSVICWVCLMSLPLFSPDLPLICSKLETCNKRRWLQLSCGHENREGWEVSWARGRLMNQPLFQRPYWDTDNNASILLDCALISWAYLYILWLPSNSEWEQALIKTPRFLFKQQFIFQSLETTFPEAHIVLIYKTIFCEAFEIPSDYFEEFLISHFEFNELFPFFKLLL